MKKRYGASRYSDEVASTATLAGAGIGVAYLIPDRFFEAAVESIKMGRRAGRTVAEVVVGNEGENAVQSLLEANLGSEQYYAEQIKLIGNLERVYEQNETLGRQTNRLGVQLKGMVSEATAVGDDVANTFSFGLFRKVDDAIMDLAGSSKDAREGLPQLQEMSRMARRFYDGREKLDKTIEGLIGHLEQVGLGVVRDNEAIENDINGMITQLDKTYKVENTVFDLHDRVSFLKTIMGKRHEELAKAGIDAGNAQVREYRSEVDNLRESVEQNAPIGSYNDPTAGLDYAINPITIGLVGAVLAKGATKLLPPIVERPLTKVLAFPSYLIRKGVQGSVYIGKRATNVYKRLRKPKELKETRVTEARNDK